MEKKEHLDTAIWMREEKTKLKITLKERRAFGKGALQHSTLYGYNSEAPKWFLGQTT